MEAYFGLSNWDMSRPKSEVLLWWDHSWPSLFAIFFGSISSDQSLSKCLSLFFYLHCCNCSAVLHFIHIIVFILLQFNKCKEQVLFYLDMRFFQVCGRGREIDISREKNLQRSVGIRFEVGQEWKKNCVEWHGAPGTVGF